MPMPATVAEVLTTFICAARGNRRAGFGRAPVDMVGFGYFYQEKPETL